MRIRRYIRIIVALLMLLMYGAGDAWALDENNILIQVIPSGKEGKGSVTATEGSVSASVSERMVTLTVTPNDGYKTKKALIIAEKMVDPNRSLARRRASLSGTFEVTASTDGWVTAATTYTFTIPAEYDGAYVTVTFVSTTSNQITSLSDITDLTADYELVQDIDASGFPLNSSDLSVLGTFSGTLDGNFHKIYNLSKPLFSSVDGGTVKNITFEDVNIISGDADGDAGAVCSKAKGSARIYNCGIIPSYTEYDEEGNIKGFTGSSVSGSGNVGGLVGKLEGTARVINCYSYANIEGGDIVGGIVGNNTVASSQSNVATMVMNCMFYGDITGGTTISPVYGGNNINNINPGGLATYNYYAYSQLKTKPITNGKYNCAMAMEERFLNRCELYRQLLNSNRKLAAIYATGNASNANQMAKWVLETADRTIINPTPYPILKAQGYYPSIINPDITNAPDSATVGRNKGGKLGKTLSVTISGVGSNYPEGASITTSSLTLQRTDKDFDRFNFNYDKVQLPYYNDVGTGNYTHNRVVTGWKITSVTGGTAGSFSEADKWGGYNFADRNCTNKDLYSVSHRVFSQGAYFDVPYGVTAITIEPYWGVAAYVSDQYYDVVYKENGNNNYSGQNVNLGTQATNNTDVSINGSTQKVYTSIDNARKSMNIPTETTSGKTVYDYAVVLVGNVHQAGVLSGEYTPYTITSVDLDKDNEPDYSFIFSHHNRQAVSPIRFDFLNVVGTAQAQKPNGISRMLNVSIFKPKGWFEVTNTCSIYFVQFEGDNGNKTSAPIIFLGGVVDQFTSTQNLQVTTSTQYIHLGSNCLFKAFGNGTHSDGFRSTRHVPVSVTGGDYDEFYLSGVYRPDAGIEKDDAECYISSGRFNEVAGAAQQLIDGNVQWQIYNADITNFYGGGINADKPITGDVTVNITNSYVNTYCGGPKFGDMQKAGTFTTIYSKDQAGNTTGTYSSEIDKDRVVTTNAVGCTFGKFFGAGYGGASSSKVKFYDSTDKDFTTSKGFDSLIGNYNNDRGKYFDGKSVSYKTNYGYKGPGVATDFDYEFFVWSSGLVGARFYVYYTIFSSAKTNNVNSTLTGCTINKDFYGGGSLGMVDGIATSVLNNCTVKGNVYGGGFSASIPSVPVRQNDFAATPIYNVSSGIFEMGKKNETTDFTWKEGTLPNNDNTALEGEKILTNVDLDNLGVVSGKTILNIEGSTTVAGSVYGGGEESDVAGDTQVNMNGGTINQNVFGGGKGVADEFSCSKAMVGVNDAGKCEAPDSDTNKDKGTKVTISNGTVNGNVYGGGEVGRVEWNTQVKIGVGTGDGPFAPVINGSVFGAGAGIETHGYSALVRGNSSVTIQANAKVLKNVYGGGEKATVGRYWVKGISTTLCSDEGTVVPTAPATLPDEMPYKTRRGGKSTVIVQGEAQIGPNDGATATAGHVFGAGKGVTPVYNNKQGDDNRSRRMVDYNSTKHTTAVEHETWDYYPDDHNYVWEYFTTEDKYFEFLQTLALVTGTDVTIGGNAKVKGSVYGGGENGFVQDSTDVKVSGGTIGTTDQNNADFGNVFGGGKGLAAFAEAGKVKGNTEVAISGDDTKVNGNVYGGGELGDVGIIDKTDKKDGQLTYNYAWKQNDGSTANIAENNKPSDSSHDTSNNTGICTVTITGGTIGTGVEMSDDGTYANGNVFGAGKGFEDTWWCEKAIVFATNVTISAGTVRGTVYGGGKVGRVEDDAKVTIGEGTNVPIITGNVFGAGAGIKTHGYSALLRGNSDVTVQGGSRVGGSVYGGGEIASVGRFTVVGGLPKYLDSGGECKVTIKDNAKIGTSGTGHNVFSACKGVTPAFDSSNDFKNNKSMQTEANRPKNADKSIKAEHVYWDYVETYDDEYEGTKFVWVYYRTEPEYLAFLKTLALTSHPYVTIGGNASVYGSVYGGGERGVTLGHVNVDITGGNVAQDVYGGGALADTNLGNWDESGGTEGAWTDDSKSALYTTNVRLTGGTISGDAYGGGLGKMAVGEQGQVGYESAIEAKVYGNTTVELNKGVADDAKGCIVKGSIFGCNNKSGTPKGTVTVHVHKTQRDGASRITNPTEIPTDEGYVMPKVLGTVIGNNDFDFTTFDVKAVYGGGNLAAYEPTDAATGKTNVIIDGCDRTSIGQVYGGGNAASTPATQVTVKGTFEIGEVFGGGNGKDSIVVNNVKKANPGANVGFRDYSATEDTPGVTPEQLAAAKAAAEYGSGEAHVNIQGGKIHAVFGGSNTKGNVREIAIAMLESEESDPDYCRFDVDEAYGGGKSADMDGEAHLEMKCIPGLTAVYGGAQDADVNNDVVLNITNGTFDQVFGGNNIGGRIMGSITVNIEETGCRPIIIGELYGGGNRAAYSVYGYKQVTQGEGDEAVTTWKICESASEAPSGFVKYGDPVVNVKSFTSIGSIYGGGYGASATMVGSPTVNISVVEDDTTPAQTHDDAEFAGLTKDIDGDEVTMPAHEKGKMGVISQVFGGGNAAKVIGDTNVNIGTLGTVDYVTTFSDKNKAHTGLKVKGVDIRGNIYGGGNQADVTGKTNVVIGQ